MVAYTTDDDTGGKFRNELIPQQMTTEIICIHHVPVSHKCEVMVFKRIMLAHYSIVCVKVYMQRSQLLIPSETTVTVVTSANNKPGINYRVFLHENSSSHVTCHDQNGKSLCHSPESCDMQINISLHH